MNTLQYSIPHLFSNFVQPLFPVASNLYLYCYFWYLISLTECVIMPLFHFMILWICKCGALVSWYHNHLDMHSMQQGIKFTEVWHIVWFFAGTLFWYHTQTHTHKDTQHTQTNRLAHLCKYILTPSVICWQQLSVLHWIIYWYQKFLFQCLFFLKISHL